MRKKSNNEFIKILGGGLSGLSAAITLANNKTTVEVYEKSLHAGGRFKRDFQCLRNFGTVAADPLEEFEKIGIQICPHKKLMRIARYSKSHHFELVSNNRPIYYVVLRGEDKESIDSQLEKTAINQGVIIHYNEKKSDKNVSIIATGPSQADSVAYGGLYEDTNIGDAGIVFLNTKYSPNGYLYVLPGKKNGEAEIINMEIGPPTSMKKTKLLYNRAIQENAVLKNLLDGATKKYTQAGIGSSKLLEKPYFNNRYYVGEAAGLQDLGAGFGIRYAIISGYLAADSILTGKNYNEQISKTFKSQLEFERKRSANIKELTNNKIDKIFGKIIEKFGDELTIEQYESFRGEI